MKRGRRGAWLELRVKGVEMNKRQTMKNYQDKSMPIRCKVCGDIKRPVAPFYVSIGRLGICANCINALKHST